MDRFKKMMAYAKKAEAKITSTGKKVEGKIKDGGKKAKAKLVETGKKAGQEIKKGGQKTAKELKKAGHKAKELGKKAMHTQGDDGTGIKKKGHKSEKETEDTKVKTKVEGRTCYVVQGDTILIGTRAELEGKINKKIGILELEASTQAAIEANIEIINDTYKKGVEGQVKGGTKGEASAKLGEHVKGTVKGEVNAEATAKAMVDLTKLMVELGAEAKVGLKIEGDLDFDLKIVDINTYIKGQLDAEAHANVVANWKGVTAEAAASAEAKATIGAKIKTKEFKIGGKPLKIELHPSVTAFAKAEAKAKAAAGLSTGVEVGAYAAVGLRGTLDVSLIGDYTIKGGLDKLKRETDEKGKSKAKATRVEGKALGTAGAEISMALSVGTSFSASPYDLKIQNINGLDYGVAEFLLHVAVPGIITGPAGVAVGLKVYVNILYEIVEDVVKKIKDAIVSFVKDVIVAEIKKAYKKFKADVEKLAKDMKAKGKEFGLDLTISVLELIGKDLKAIDVEIKRRDDMLLDLNKTYMEDQTNESNRKKLEKEFKEYNLYVEKAFDYQQEKIYKIIDTCEDKVDEIRKKKGDASKDELKALKKAKSQTESTIKRMNELIKTKKMILIYLEPNRKVLGLESIDKIINDTKDHLQSMEETLNTLQKFVKAVG